jgi:DNA-binding response OmpR family regulator
MRKKPRILVIEHEPAIRRLCERELGREGYVVAGASSHLEGIEAMRRQEPDLVILDFSVRWTDGLGSLSRFLEERSDIPFVIHSAGLDHRDDFLSWAADAYLIKSSDFSELKRTVRRLLAEARASSPVIRWLAARSGPHKPQGIGAGRDLPAETFIG